MSRRRALVIGNSTYQHCSVLKNPTNDASDIATRLTSNDFDVVQLTDVTAAAMHQALHDFGIGLAGADLGVFFFAGHGIQIDGGNYLLATDTDPATAVTAAWTSLALNKVIETMEAAGIESNVIILDACRDDPFKPPWRSGAPRGLASVYAPRGTLIGFATSPGQIALDGKSRNGEYTSALLKHIDTPDVSIENMFKRVRNTLSAATGAKQISWEHTSLSQEIFLRLGLSNQITQYTTAALIDSRFLIDTTQPDHAIIALLKTHNFYRQNDGIAAITAPIVEAANPDTLFVLGRNIYQSACGGSNDAISYINKFAQCSQAFSPERTKAMLDGMIFEIFFDAEGNVRDKAKSTYFNEVFELQRDARFTDTFDFIASALAPHRDKFHILPGKAQAKSVDVVVAANKRVESVLMDGKSIVRKFGRDRDPNDADSYETLAREHFEERLTSEALLPKHLVHFAYSSGNPSSIHLMYGTTFRKHDGNSV